MDRWFWCDSALVAGETVLDSVDGIRLYDGDKKTGYEDGFLTLTNHRLLWKHSSNNSSLALSLDLVVLVEEEGGGFTSSPKAVLHLSLPPHTKPAGPVTSSSNSHIKLSFRHGRPASIMKNLQKSISDREWEKVPSQNLPLSGVTSGLGGRPIRAGILGIERAIHERAQKTDQNINKAFEDLNQLMGLAKDMVILSKSISTKIKEHSGEISADETTQFRSYLLSMGIDDPVTKETYGSTSQYHQELAKELARAMEEPIREAGGMMLVSEVYCRINRARGLHLLSPEDVLNACKAMQGLGLPLRLHVFDSGVCVVQLSSLQESSVVAETEMVLLEKQEGISSTDLARLCGISVMLAQERLLQAERAAKAVRDESSEGLRFFPNLFFSKA
ncbi:vacuolar protein sorting 36 [Oratosquilla oratoria]|uniref:vacuolar protein sorting 36 n=1 Tax=Oratosquilla oratoria TaxID=337810 RepID=UPI003F75CA6B